MDNSHFCYRQWLTWINFCELQFNFCFVLVPNTWVRYCFFVWMFTPKLLEMSRFDLCICFRWVGEKPPGSHNNRYNRARWLGLLRDSSEKKTMASQGQSKVKVNNFSKSLVDIEVRPVGRWFFLSRLTGVVAMKMFFSRTKSLCHDGVLIFVTVCGMIL